MEWLDVSTENCPVQSTLDLVGEKWTLLILRDAFIRVRRFDDFRRHLGLSDAVLADRLRKLVAADILTAVPYQQAGSRTRHEYRLTSKGRDLWPILMALRQWGETYAAAPKARSSTYGTPSAARRSVWWWSATGRTAHSHRPRSRPRPDPRRGPYEAC